MKALSYIAIVALSAAYMLGLVGAESSLLLAVMGAVDPEKIQVELNRISDQVKSFAQGAMKEIKASGSMSQQTRDELSRLATAHAEHSARLQTAEQILAKFQHGGGGGYSQAAGGPSLGTQAVGRLNEDAAFIAAAGASQRGMKP
jgi:hypothetical protein